eukprot:7236625-Alexandrium_andersonii.AAC.1
MTPPVSAPACRTLSATAPSCTPASSTSARLDERNPDLGASRLRAGRLRAQGGEGTAGWGPVGQPPPPEGQGASQPRLGRL